MALTYEPTPEQKTEWDQWVAERPGNVRRVAERFNPWTLYRHKDTDQRVTLYSFGEQSDGGVTLTVDITGEFNLISFNRQVFGIDPDDLEECDLPVPDELLGEYLNEDEQFQYINVRRKSNGLPPLVQ